MGKRVLKRGIPGLAVALGVTALVIFFLLLYGREATGLAQRLPQVGVNLTARPADGVVAYSLLLSNQEQSEITLDRIEVRLPDSQGYVGLAASSGVSVEPFKEEQALVWSGPFILSGEGSLTLDFWAVAVRGEASGLSQATVYVGGTAVASEEGEVTVAPWSAPAVAAPVSVSVGEPSPSITVTKSVTPTTTFPNRPVLYTAIFTNTTGSDAVLNVITDTFSSSLLRHVGPAYGSDIVDWPEPLGGSSVTWTGPYTVTAGSSLTLAYWAWVGETLEEQPITNSLQAEAGDGSVGPVTETLDIEIAKVFLPLTMKDFSLAPPASLEDHFDANAENWTPFLNYGRLKPQQWFWDAGGGYSGGGYRHNMYLGGTEAHDALSMYLQGNSQEWTDYSFQARVIIRDGEAAGLWFRGTYPEDDESAGVITGYYFIMTGSAVRLSQMQTADDCVEPACTNQLYFLDFNNPRLLASASRNTNIHLWHLLKVEVEGARIRGYVDGELLIDYDDTPIPDDGIKNDTVFLEGTVGFKTYKCANVVFDDVLVTALP